MTQPKRSKFLLYGVTRENINEPKLEFDNVLSVPAIYLKLWNDKRPYQIWYGARFTAKSWTKALQLLLKCDNEDYCRVVFARNTQKAARQSQFQLFQDILKRKPMLKDKFEVSKSEMKITNISSGNYLQGGSFEQPESLMSVPDVTDFWAEEPISRLGSIDRDSFLDIAGTLRNSYGKAVIFHFTFNPIGKGNFIYDDFFNADTLRYDESTVCKVKPSPFDNPYCPQDRLDFLENMKIHNPSRHRVDGLGLWGQPIIGNEFYHFQESNHVKSIDYDNTSAIYYAMDYNFNPYMPSSVWQVKRIDGLIHIRCIKEYALKSPLNNIKASCQAFIKDFKNHKGSIYLIDDATGQGKSPINSDPEINSLRKRFKKEMSSVTKSYKFRKSNPRIADRRDEVNDALSEVGKFRIEIDESCLYTIKDFGLVKINHDGKKLKEKYKAKDIAKGLKGEKYGHFSDIADYVITVIIENEQKLKVGSNWRVQKY